MLVASRVLCAAPCSVVALGARRFATDEKSRRQKDAQEKQKSNLAELSNLLKREPTKQLVFSEP